ncbi:MAG: hypothetical protein B7Z75_05930 [Acidocella sp. 20-57-95]|nr:MAG: hypothetical protein B7Z75_05930 [Acidocella sp. 20-57-95]OYV58462.1 MAG: hypothetical protein B7Z71_10160 [Acidocella sp. 21-58-7]HQT65181.1 hypothetical protein [Acidocella sp.]HQU04961.1 hypothetical protein [Acidocella sp.]
MRLWLGLFGVAAACNIILGWHGWPTVFAGSLSDPDSYMRLERILQGVQQGHLTNIVARDDSGAGVMVEWSRLLDALLWAMALPFVPFIGWQHALLLAGDTLSPLGIGLLGVALAFVIEPFVARPFLWATAVAAAVLPGLQTFAAPGVVHYHILLLALIAATMGFVVRACHGERWNGFIAGLCGGLAIWLTPETMPFILLAFAVLLLQWCFTKNGDVVTACAVGFADMLAFGLALDPPEGGYAVVEIDRISIVYVILALALVLGSLCLWRIDHRTTTKSGRPLGVVIMAAFLIAWVVAFPTVAMGPYGLMNASDYQRFFGVMLELQPLHGPHDYLQFVFPGALVLFYSLFRCVQARSLQARLLWLYLSGILILSLVLAAKFILFVGFPAEITAALVGVMLSDVSVRFRAAPMRAMLARLGCITSILVIPLLPIVPAIAQAPISPALPAPSCDLRHIDHLLAPIGGAVTLATADATPELLFRTKITTVGSLYQHGVSGFLRLRDAWRSLPGTAIPAAVTATKANYILFCGSPLRSLLVNDLAATSLWDALNNAQTPPWLQLQAQDTATGWRLYKIIR